MIKRLLLIVIPLAVFSIEQVMGQLTDPLKVHIRELITTVNQNNKSLNGGRLVSTEELTRLYKNQSFTSLWWWRGKLNRQAGEALNLILASYFEGLNPNDYHANKLVELFNSFDNKKSSQETKLAFEILLTDGLLTYMRHLYGGKVRHDCPEASWHAVCKDYEINYSAYLQNSLRKLRLTENINILSPKNEGYINLKKALSDYRHLNSEYDQDSSYLTKPYWNNYADIRDKLILNGDLLTSARLDTNNVVTALINFKQRHGLSATSDIDEQVAAELNAKIESRINTILANLERWRWLPTQLDEKYISVNIANFELDVIDNGVSIWNTEVMVGTEARKTTVLSALVLGVTVNPIWTIPPTILKEDILPLGNGVPDYLVKHHIEVLNHDKELVVPDSITWSDFKVNSPFPYTLRQTPGVWNALGKIKFIMPNSNLVYLHDTPSKSLFNESLRAFSSGCIRVSKPYDLARLLFEMERNSKIEELQEIIDADETRHLMLDEPMSAHILYWTSWVDSNGHINFRNDIYGFDNWLIEELKSPPQPYPSNY